MTARWLLEAMYKLGLSCDAAADYAKELMSRSTEPSWGYMISNASATTTLEAWAPYLKWNTDFSHPVRLSLTSFSFDRQWLDLFGPTLRTAPKSRARVSLRPTRFASYFRALLFH